MGEEVREPRQGCPEESPGWNPGTSASMNKLSMADTVGRRGKREGSDALRSPGQPESSERVSCARRRLDGSLAHSRRADRAESGQSIAAALQLLRPCRTTRRGGPAAAMGEFCAQSVSRPRAAEKAIASAARRQTEGGAQCTQDPGPVPGEVPAGPRPRGEMQRGPARRMTDKARLQRSAPIPPGFHAGHSAHGLQFQDRHCVGIV